MTDKPGAETPRTDAYYETYDAWMAFAKKNPNMPPELAEQCPIECSPDEFARQLERELSTERAARAAAEGERNKLSQGIGALMASVTKNAPRELATAIMLDAALNKQALTTPGSQP